jgi:hypothetical protein
VTLAVERHVTSACSVLIQCVFEGAEGMVNLILALRKRALLLFLIGFCLGYQAREDAESGRL